MNAKQIGQIKKLARYPVKSMAGIAMEQSALGWHGLVGDRRYGVRQIDKAGDFPWLTASRMPELLLYQPEGFDNDSSELLPTHVRNPKGELLDIHGESLREEIGRQAGTPVELMALKHGIFDDSFISVIASSTAAHLCAEAGVADDSRRFRANIEITCDQPTPFIEDQWVGSIITFGDSADPPAVYVTKRDIRCKMIGLDPDTGEHQTSLVKTSNELNDNHAGVYGSIVQTGALHIGDRVYWRKAQ